MGATGHFGHRAHSTGNLTALVAQLFREQRAEEDRVMFDAYQNGGKGLDGKPVTDKAMRAYIARRRGEFDKADPTYSEWNNRLIQLDFKIGEEKVQLAYKQGHVGAGAVAAYYRHQLNTIPKDSAFYRDVAGRAADWAKAAQGAARGAARARLTSALEGRQNGVAKTWGNYSQLEGILTDAAKRAGLIAGNQTLTDADATDLQAFLQRGVPGPHGTTITFDDWRNAAVSAYKAFDTQIAINKQLNRGTKELTSGKDKFLNQNLVRINTIDDRAKYELAYDSFNQAVMATADPRQKLALAQAYVQTLTNIRDTAMKAGTGLSAENDPEFIGGLNNEIQAITTGKASGPTVTDLQRTSTEAVSLSDAESTAQDMARAQQEVQQLANGTAIFGQDKFGGAFKVIPLPPASTLDPTGRGGLDESFQPSVLNLDGVPTQVMLKGEPVQATGLTDNAGNPVQMVHGTPVENLSQQELQSLLANGYSLTKQKDTIGYVFQQGDQTTYGVKQADGSLTFTTKNPFSGTILGTDSLQVITGSTTNQAGDTVAAPPPIQTNPQDTTNFLTDSSVSPKDLRALAAVSDQQTAAQLIEAAATQEGRARAQRLGGVNDMSLNSQMSQQDVMVKTVSDAFHGLTQTVSTIFGPRNTLSRQEGDQPPPALPTLNPITQIAPPSFTNAQQSVAPAPTVPKAATAPSVGTEASSGKVKDDYTNPSTGSSGGYAVGAASIDLINKYLHPPTGSTAHPGSKPL